MYNYYFAPLIRTAREEGEVILYSSDIGWQDELDLAVEEQDSSGVAWSAAVAARVDAPVPGGDPVPVVPLPRHERHRVQALLAGRGDLAPLDLLETVLVRWLRWGK